MPYLPPPCLLTRPIQGTRWIYPRGVSRTWIVPLTGLVVVLKSLINIIIYYVLYNGYFALCVSLWFSWVVVFS